MRVRPLFIGTGPAMDMLCGLNCLGEVVVLCACLYCAGMDCCMLHAAAPCETRDLSDEELVEVP